MSEARKEDSRKSFAKTPKGWQERWNAEMAASEKMLEKFNEQGIKIFDRYLDKRGTNESLSRLNLFHSGINTVKSMLYGQTPKVVFDRRHADADDDVGRVASTMLERKLNADIERPDDDYTAVLRNALDDRLIPGLGVGRVRYEASFENITIPAVYSEDGVELAPEFLEPRLKSERAVVEYVHWKDFRWSYARTWHEVRWIAFKAYLTYDELEARFGEKKAKKVPLKEQYRDEKESDYKDAWSKGEVWEIWNKEDKRVYWWVDGVDEILDEMDDTLQLTTFFPAPRPMMANTTTNLLVPRADFVLAQDLYDQIDILNTRINVLTEAVRLVGVYDKQNESLQRMLKESADNEMIPVENWAMFAEKNGLKGVVDWFPLEEVVNTLDKLRELREEQIGLLYQITGLSDILRGQSAGSDRVSATEQSIKAKFASVRMQAMQDEFARFGTDLIRLKGEVVARHCRPEMIIEGSNIMHTPDAQMAMAAVELIKNQEAFVWRVSVRPESMAMVDYQGLQQERGEYINGLATFMQSATPMLERVPNSMGTLIELLKWGLAGFKGSDNIEAVLDRAGKEAVEAAKNPPPPQPDPAMVKAQAEMQKMQAEMQMEQQRMQLEMQQKMFELEQNAKMAQQEFQQDMMKFQQEMMQDREKHMMEMQQLREKTAVQAEAGRQKLSLGREAAKVKNDAIQSKPKSPS